MRGGVLAESGAWGRGWEIVGVARGAASWRWGGGLEAELVGVRLGPGASSWFRYGRARRDQVGEPGGAWPGGAGGPAGALKVCVGRVGARAGCWGSESLTGEARTGPCFLLHL